MSSVRGWCLALMVMAGALTTLFGAAQGAKLADVRVVDDEHVQVHLLDGEVEWKDTGTGPTAFHGGCDSAGEVIHKFNPPLDTAAAVKAANYTLSSAADKNYQAAVNPTAAYRKSKVSGTDRDWPNCNCTIEHTIYLALPKKMQQGAKYTLKIAAGVNSDTASKDFTFDVFSSVSEAIHVNLIGYNPADHGGQVGRPLYVDGRRRGAGLLRLRGPEGLALQRGHEDRDGSRHGRASGRRTAAISAAATSSSRMCGTAISRRSRARGRTGWRSRGSGAVRILCSSKSVYYEPFKTSVRGFFYMRIGEGKEWAMGNTCPSRASRSSFRARTRRRSRSTGPRTARSIRTGRSPAATSGTTSIGPSTTSRATRRTPNAWGGHSDATDWDRNPGHISIIWDLLLPYILSGGKISDDNCQIRESGNGIPDLLDEANYETDFWLRLRDGKGGYSCGINNPSQKDTVMYQAGASPYMAWASAANAAMTAEAFRIAGRPDLVKKYVAAATEAWKTANEEGLDLAHGIGNGEMRGRDLKFMAAAYLYNVTGEKSYEDAMAKECRINGPTAEIDTTKSNQLWGAAAYVLCAKNKVQPIHYPKLAEDMKAAIIHEAMKKNVANSHVVAQPAQQQQRVRVVPEHPGGADGVRGPCDFGRRRGEGGAPEGAGAGGRLGPGPQPDEHGADDGPGEPVRGADVHVRPERRRPRRGPRPHAVHERGCVGERVHVRSAILRGEGVSGVEGVAARRGAVAGAVLFLEQRVHAAAIDAREDVSAGVFVFAGGEMTLDSTVKISRSVKFIPVKSAAKSPRK